MAYARQTLYINFENENEEKKAEAAGREKQKGMKATHMKENIFFSS